MLRLFKALACLCLVFLLVLITRLFVIPTYILPKEYSSFVEKYSKEYNVPENMVYAVIHTESRFKCEALSYKNAMGLMQITEGTGEWIGGILEIEDYSKEMLYDPETNIRIGTYYLSSLLKQFGSYETALAAYNAGSGNVAKWLCDSNYSSDGINLDTIPFEETLNYVKRVNMLSKLYDIIY